MGSKTGPQRQQSGESTVRDPPPYPGHLQLWQQSGYSTSYSGSEASTDMSMSSLESLSTSARQDPQGEETTNVSPSLVDSYSTGLSSSAEAVVSSGFGSELDLKLLGVDSGGGGGGGPLANTLDPLAKDCEPSQGNGLPQRECYNSLTSSKSSIPAAYGQLPSYCSGNSLIRQLLQASPQFSHLLSDLAPLHGGTSAFGSPKLQHGTISEVHSRQVFPVSSTSGSLTSTSSSRPNRFHASNSRTRNGYVNLVGDENTGSTASLSTTAAAVSQNPSSSSSLSSTSKSLAPSRDRVRPSTAPTERSSPAAALDSGIVSTAAATTTTTTTPSEPMKQGSRRSYDVLDSNPKSRNDKKSAPPESDENDNNIRGIVNAAPPIKPSAGSTKQEIVADSNQRVSPVKRPEGAAVVDKGDHAQPSHRAQCTDSVQENTASCSQRTSSRSLQESPTTQQRSSPNVQQQKLSDVGSSCPLQGDGQLQQTVCAHAAIATRATQMVERLSEENRGLRQELKVYYKKVSKLEKVERDIQKIGEAYENLSQQSQKRENLEKLMRMRLESDISHLNDINRQLQDQLESSLLRLQRKQGYISPDSELKKEVQRKDCLIARLIAQNRELLGAKLKLESDMMAHRSALQDSQSRLHMLENILAKEALEKRRLFRQRSVSSDYLQGAGSAPSTNHEPEEDFHVLHQQCDTDDGIASDSESTTNIRGLIRQIQEKDGQVHRLESEVAKWESKFLEETVFRQLAVDAISIPKDAKIAALVQNSADSDRLLAETRLEKLAYMKELHESNERCAQLEARVKSLQADLIERESLIHVLQRHPSLSRASSISSLLAASASCASPLNSPQQQHRSPNGTVLVMTGGGAPSGMAGSKQSSASSSRQSSQLSGSLTHHGKINGLAFNASPDVQNSHKKFSHMEAKPSPDYDTDQLQQCFWQV